ncbi:MAG: glycosyltransferase family 4 protein [Gammaproteobacteria bacterium]|nr:glycosyltransferase family 4 protein [Gammaproteobacteria bacterium]
MTPSAAVRVQEAPATLLYVVNVAWFFLSHRLELARAALADGFRVHLAADVENESEIADVRGHGIVFHRLHMTRSGLNPLEELRTRAELRDIVRAVQPHILHNVTVKPILHGTDVAGALGVRGVVNAVSGFGHVYSSRRHLLRALLDRAYARAFRPANVRIIVQNQTDRSEVLRLCPSAAGRTHLVFGSGVDLSQFQPTPELAGTPSVLLPARLLRDKGIAEFAAAAAQLRRSGPSARFLVAGRLDPGNRGALSAQEVGALSAASGMQWLGERGDMAQCLREAHIVCLPSYREGVPKALLEACAAGRPIVTTDAPGCRDVVRDGENGLLVPVGNAEALAAAIRRLLNDAALRTRMGQAGRARAEREFGLERVVQVHLDMYREFTMTAATFGRG